MSLRIRIFTMNCGNGSPGRESCQELATSFSTSDNDVWILHAQETNIPKSRHILNALAKKYHIIVHESPAMITHTSLLTHFHHHSGLVTFILSKPDIAVLFNSTKTTRRGHYRWQSGANKGGMVHDVSIRKDNITYKIMAINAHLDAFSSQNRLKDMRNILNLIWHIPSSYDYFKNYLPDIIVSGMDANTRNIHMNNNFFNPWRLNQNPDMNMLIKLNSGHVRQSSTSTYGHPDALLPFKKDHKRQGFAKGGMLDIVAHNGMFNQNHNTIIKPCQTIIPKVLHHRRDHAIIGSHVIDIEKRTDFDKVRLSIASALYFIAPNLSKICSDDAFLDTEKNRQLLQKLHQDFLRFINMPIHSKNCENNPCLID